MQQDTPNESQQLNSNPSSSQKTSSKQFSRPPHATNRHRGSKQVKPYVLLTNEQLLDNLRNTFENEKGQKFICHLIIAFLYDTIMPVVATMPEEIIKCGLSNQPIQGKIDFLSDNHDVLTIDIDQLYKTITDKQFEQISAIPADLAERAVNAGLGFKSVSSIEKVLSIQSIAMLQAFVIEQNSIGNKRLMAFIEKNRKDKGKNTTHNINGKQSSDNGKQSNEKPKPESEKVITKKATNKLSDNSELQKLKETLK